MKLTLEESLKTLEGRSEFAIKKYGEGNDRLVCLNYLVTLPDSFEGIRSEFRGIIFDGKTGEVVSRPFHKYFNINQKEETQYHLIKDMKATVYEKVDGSMIHFFMEPCSNARWMWRIVGSTRMSYETPQAQAATLMAWNNKEVWGLISDNIKNGYTPMFEFVGPENQIVVAYPKRRLVYLHSRHLETGKYWFDERFPDKATRYEIDFGDIFNHIDKEEFEGYVCQLENGMWVKVKGKWYQDRHRAVDDLMRPAYKMYEKALNNELDDVYACAPDRYKPILQDIMEEAARDFSAMRGLLFRVHKECLEEAWTKDRKGFVMRAKAQYPDLFSGLMTVYDNKEPTEYITKRLMSRYTVEKASRLAVEPIDLEG
jgi:RNA ligase